MNRTTGLPWYSKAAAVAVIAAALFLAFPGERDLALLAGWDNYYAWAMPFVLSAYAGVTAIMAAATKRGSAGYTSTRAAAVFALLLPMAAQIAAHLIDAGHLTVGPVLIAATSAVPPLVVGHTCHLLTASRVRATAEPAAEAADEIDNLRSELVKVRAARMERPEEASSDEQPQEPEAPQEAPTPKLPKADADHIITEGWRHGLSVAEVAKSATRHSSTVSRAFKRMEAEHGREKAAA